GKQCGLDLRAKKKPRRVWRGGEEGFCRIQSSSAKMPSGAAFWLRPGSASRTLFREINLQTRDIASHPRINGRGQRGETARGCRRGLFSSSPDNSDANLCERIKGSNQRAMNSRNPPRFAASP